MKKPNGNQYDNIKNILIVNVHSSHNAGDFALLIQTIYYLETTFGKVNISILANWPNEEPIKSLNRKITGSPWWVIKVWDKTKKPRYQVLSLIFGIFLLLFYKIAAYKKFYKIIPQEWLAIFDEYKNSDLVVAVSGNQLFSSGRFGWPLPVVGFPIYIARFLGKKTIIFPQSIGPLSSWFDRQLVKYLYNNVDKLFIRDIESLHLVQDLRITKSKPSFMPDVAFTFPPDTQGIAKSVLTTAGYDDSKNNIGITIISSMPSYLSSKTMLKYYKSIAEMIRCLVEDHGFEVFLFCQVFGPTDDENDFIGIEQVIQLLPDQTKERLHYPQFKFSAAELKACYGLMDLFIASRLHSGIFALGMRVPTLFVGYLHKTLGVLKSIQMIEQHIDLHEISSDLLIKKVLKMWKEKRDLQETVNFELTKVEEQLGDLPNEILEAVKHYDN